MEDASEMERKGGRRSRRLSLTLLPLREQSFRQLFSQGAMVSPELPGHAPDRVAPELALSPYLPE